MSKKKRRMHSPGTPPGTLKYYGDNPDISYRIIIVKYGPNFFEETELKDFNDFEKATSEPPNGINYWIRIIGLKDVELLSIIGKKFNIHELTLEDILNIYQRPKIEEYQEYIFTEINRISLKENGIESDQISIFFNGKTLITFQDTRDDFYKTVSDRLRNGSLATRAAPDYLNYVLFDYVVDEYFVVLEEITDRIEALQDELINDSSTDDLEQLRKLNKDVQKFRQNLWPVRDIVNRFHKKEIAYFSPETFIYLNDTYDHVYQLIDNVESQREILLSLMNFYLSNVSIKLNDVMRILTIIATIFIPLTFIAGVYGMNFKNMPEIESPWGYPVVMTVMFFLFIGFIVYFKKKKWL